MFNKRDIEGIKGSLNEISNELKSIKEENSELRKLHVSHSKRFEDISRTLESFKSSQSCCAKDMGEELREICNIRSEFSKSARSFELLNQKIYDQLYSKLHEVLREHTNDLKSTTDNYKSLSPKVQEIMEILEALSSEVSKFNAIARTIKEADYSLVKHQKDLERLDREKLHMLKKIDSLQRMVGRYRRNKEY